MEQGCRTQIAAVLMTLEISKVPTKRGSTMQTEAPVKQALKLLRREAGAAQLHGYWSIPGRAGHWRADGKECGGSGTTTLKGRGQYKWWQKSNAQALWATPVLPVHLWCNQRFFCNGQRMFVTLIPTCQSFSASLTHLSGSWPSGAVWLKSFINSAVDRLTDEQTGHCLSHFAVSWILVVPHKQRDDIGDCGHLVGNKEGWSSEISKHWLKNCLTHPWLPSVVFRRSWVMFGHRTKRKRQGKWRLFMRRHELKMELVPRIHSSLTETRRAAVKVWVAAHGGEWCWPGWQDEEENYSQYALSSEMRHMVIRKRTERRKKSMRNVNVEQLANIDEHFNIDVWLRIAVFVYKGSEWIMSFLIL